MAQLFIPFGEKRAGWRQTACTEGEEEGVGHFWPLAGKQEQMVGGMLCTSR
jgi:hypothetical protein